MLLLFAASANSCYLIWLLLIN